LSTDMQCPGGASTPPGRMTRLGRGSIECKLAPVLRYISPGQKHFLCQEPLND
jgi:hypothetical protein